MKDRDTLIDIAKGFGILLVVFAHTNKGEFTGIIYLFHMPLFFILTGCALNYSSTSNIKWNLLIKRGQSKQIYYAEREKGRMEFKRLAKGIVIPYLVFSLITFAYWALVESRFRPVHDSEVISGLSGILSFKAQQLVNIFIAMDTKDAFVYNIVMWYLPCLFVCRVLYGLISKIKHSLFVVAVLACIGIYVAKYIVFPWCMELALVALPFIWLGHIYYVKCKKYLNRNISLMCILGGVLLVFLGKETDISINMLEHDFAGGWIYLTAIAGSLATLGVCSLLKGTKIDKPLAFLGKNSLIIMCLHEPLKRILIKLMAVATGWETDILRQDYTVSIVIVAATVVILLPCIYAINRWTPWMAGKGKM